MDVPVLACCISIMNEYTWRKNDHYIWSYNITLFILLCVKVSVGCDGDRLRQGDKDRLLYWPITSSPGHTTLCYLQDPTWHFICFSTGGYSTNGLLNRRPAAPTSWESKIHTDSLTAYLTWASAYIISHACDFRLTTGQHPLIFTGASCLENLWFDMQQAN